MMKIIITALLLATSITANASENKKIIFDKVINMACIGEDRNKAIKMSIVKTTEVDNKYVITMAFKSENRPMQTYRILNYNFLSFDDNLSDYLNILGNLGRSDTEIRFSVSSTVDDYVYYKSRWIKVSGDVNITGDSISSFVRNCHVPMFE